MGKEQLFSESEILLSTTDLDSHIKYANKHFCDIAGYSLDEMVGKPHNMVRHGDMPKAAFKDLWHYIRDGKSWMGPVKNRCKNGDYYWVNAFVTPIKDAQGKTFEYQSVRTCPERDVVKRAEDLYAKLNRGETPRVITQQIDMTLICQALFSLIFVFSIASPFVGTSLWLAVPMMLASLAGTVAFSLWRKKYQELIKEAKSVFDNKLMSYLYSGTNDDIGALSLALKMRKAELNAVVGRVSDVSETITDTAQQSSNRGEEVASILSSQKDETSQIATAVSEMSSTIQEIAQVVAESSTTAQQGLDISASSQSVVSETINAINQLSHQLSEVDHAITRLTDGSRAIETVLDEISSIADQTNLLALNAAIEAARAGEQGRGFAVVAEEVRALAMRTQQSTEEINKLLTQLQYESNFAIEAMSQGNTLSNNCVTLAGQTGESLTRINTEVNQLASISDQIATAVEEQSVVAEQVSQNIIAISDMSAESEEHGRTAVDLSSTLLANLTEQNNLIVQFRS